MNYPSLGVVKVGEDGRITDLQEKPQHPETMLGSMGIYIIKRERLISLLEECVAHGDNDLVKDIIIKKLDTLGVYGYRFKGYWRSFTSIQMYYSCNMELLNPETRRELFVENGKIYTKVKDEAPSKYNEEAEVTNSIVADGCIIEGTVENSVLFRGVTVGKEAVIRNSIVMQGSQIGENAQLDYAILDKNVVMSHGRHLKGEPSWPIVVGKDAVV